MATRIAKGAELLSEAFRKAPVYKISAWPLGIAPRNEAEGYAMAAESHALLGLPVVGWKVLDTMKTQVRLWMAYECVMGDLIRS